MSRSSGTGPASRISIVADAGSPSGEPRALTSNTAGARWAARSGATTARACTSRTAAISGRCPPPAARRPPCGRRPRPEMNIVPSPDGARVAFVRRRPARRAGRAARDLVVRSLADGKETRVAHDDHGIGALSWAPDGAHLAYAAGSESIRHEQTPEYSGAKIIYTITERTPGQTLRGRRDGRQGRRGRHARRLRRRPLARRAARRLRPDVGRLQAAHDLRRRHRRRRAARRRPRTSIRSSGAFRATRRPGASRPPTASGSRSSAIATAGTTST